MTATQYLRWECLEPGCAFVAEANEEDELVEAVQGHMSTVHNTFELEDVIIANATTLLERRR